MGLVPKVMATVDSKFKLKLQRDQTEHKPSAVIESNVPQKKTVKSRCSNIKFLVFSIQSKISRSVKEQENVTYTKSINTDRLKNSKNDGLSIQGCQNSYYNYVQVF